MMQSIRVKNSVELINITPVNPLISKCEIKVCYVGDEPNRNKSIITKAVATEMANSLPGSPIVGCFNEQKGDFEEHERELAFENGKLILKDGTRPYGFVDLHAPVWFEKFIENGIEREYLMTNGYIWTGQYPEAQRIIDKGNNQSMELDQKIIDAHWTKDNNGQPQFFIINEAIISKLCILGEDCEPCFEGAQITGINFSLEDEFENKMFALMKEMKNILEGGTSTMDNIEKIDVEENAPEITEPIAEEVVVPTEEPQVEPVIEEESAPAGEENPEPSVQEPVAEPAVASYNLDDVVEYHALVAEHNDLLTQYSALEARVNELVSEKESLADQIAQLTAFKAAVDKEKKESMIKSFYMLSDDEKREVVENIDNYSLDEIEAKLSIICVRNKVNFSLDDDNDENSNIIEQPVVYNLQDCEDLTPAWIKSIKTVAENM